MVVFEVCRLFLGAFPFHHVARSYYQNKKLLSLPLDMYIFILFYFIYFLKKKKFWVCECKANYPLFLIRAFAKFQGVLPHII